MIGRHLRQLVGAVALVALGAASAQASETALQRDAEDALASWDVMAAERLVERLNAEAPHDPQNLFLTGHLHLMRGRYAQAVEYLSQAVHAGATPLAAHYLELAEAVERETRDYVHHETADGRFIISHPPGVDEVLVPLAEDALGKALTELTRIFDYTPDHPLRIELYPTVDVLGAVSPLTVAEIRTSGTIALCKYNRLMVTSPRDLVYGYDWIDTISHEMIHLLITKKSRNAVPIWLHEGLAKYYEAAWKGEGFEPELGRHSEALLADALAEDRLITFEEMSPSMAKLPSQEATGTAFAEVFTVIEFLNHRHKGDVAAELVSLMGQGKSDRDAVSQVGGLPFDRFERAWRSYLKGKGYRPQDAAYERRLLFKGEHSEADELDALKVDKAKDYVWLGDRMRMKKRWRAASKEYRKAVPHVGDKSPMVQGKLGYALLRQGRFDEAAAELEKPIEEFPRHVLLSVYLGEALYNLGKVEEARAHLERVLTINPFDPDVHQTLARVYERLGEPELAAREREAHRLVNP